MITTKLDRTRLDKESMINQDDDGASRLFNGIQHIRLLKWKSTLDILEG